MFRSKRIRHNHHNRFTVFFPGPPGWVGARRELLDFMLQGKINRSRHIDNLDGRHSIRTSQCPPPPSPAYSSVWTNYRQKSRSTVATNRMILKVKRSNKRTTFVESKHSNRPIRSVSLETPGTGCVSGRTEDHPRPVDEQHSVTPALSLWRHTRLCVDMIGVDTSPDDTPQHKRTTFNH